MTVDQLTNAIVKAFLQGGEGFLEGTLAAALPLLWLLAVALHLARPYMVRTTQKFSLRLGADLWWLVYVGIRDLLLGIIAIASFMYLYPDVVTADALPIGGSLATALLYGALLVKLVADADDDPRAFQLVSVLLAVGSALYIVPTLIGVQLAGVTSQPWASIAGALVTSSDTGVAVAFCWTAVAAIAVMAVTALWYDLRVPPGAQVGRSRRGFGAG